MSQLFEMGGEFKCGEGVHNVFGVGRERDEQGLVTEGSKERGEDDVGTRGAGRERESIARVGIHRPDPAWVIFWLRSTGGLSRLCCMHSFFPALYVGPLHGSTFWLHFMGQ